MAITLAGMQLRKASFKGVPFYVTDAKLTAGRRVVVHEYPQRDKPYVEDLGRATRTITQTVFVCGRDYIDQAKRLIAVIESPGSGTLIHPWLGSMTVSVSANSTLTFVDGKSRYASISLTFVESGELSFPNIKNDSLSLARRLSDKLKQTAIGAFVSQIDLTGVSSYIDAAMSGDLLDVLGVIERSELAAIFDFSDQLATLAQDGLSLLSNDSSVFANQLANAIGLSRFSSSEQRWSAVSNQVSNILHDKNMSEGTEGLIRRDVEAVVISDVQLQVLTNRAALETLSRQLLIAETVGASTMVGLPLDNALMLPISETSEVISQTSYDEVIAVRENTLTMLEQEILFCNDDEVYDALCDARSAVFSCLTEKAEGLGHLTDIHLQEVMPALVIAYDYHGDSNREAEVVARNKIQNAGFCPVDLKVMTQ